MIPKLPKDLLAVFAAIDDERLLARLFADLFTGAEIESASERWAIVKLLKAGRTQRDVAQALGVSVTTVNRGNRQLKYGSGGFAAAIEMLAEEGEPK